EEQVAVVTLEEIRLVAALFPVVAGDLGDGILTLSADHVVAPRATLQLVVAASTVGEVLARAPQDQVEAAARLHVGVARVGLDHVVAGDLGDDIVTLAAADLVATVATLEGVVTTVAVDRVAVVAALDPVVVAERMIVSDRGIVDAVVDRLGVDARR